MPGGTRRHDLSGKRALNLLEMTELSSSEQSGCPGPAATVSQDERVALPGAVRCDAAQ